MQEKLWSHLGAENNAEWLTDPTGTEMAFAGLNATLRDYARFGLLYLNQGRNFQGKQLVPVSWVKASVTPDAPHLMPGRDNPGSDWPMGYGFSTICEKFSPVTRWLIRSSRQSSGAIVTSTWIRWLASKRVSAVVGSVAWREEARNNTSRAESVFRICSPCGLPTKHSGKQKTYLLKFSPPFRTGR